MWPDKSQHTRRMHECIVAKDRAHRSHEVRLKRERMIRFELLQFDGSLPPLLVRGRQHARRPVARLLAIRLQPAQSSGRPHHLRSDVKYSLSVRQATNEEASFTSPTVLASPRNSWKRVSAVRLPFPVWDIACQAKPDI